MKKSYHIGLDVHKETVAIALAISGRRAESAYKGECGGRNLAVERTLPKIARELGVAFKSLKVCNEAGPTGFALAGRLQQLGAERTVISQTRTGRKPDDKVKTDRRDAIRLDLIHEDIPKKSWMRKGFPEPVGLCRNACLVFTARRCHLQPLFQSLNARADLIIDGPISNRSSNENKAHFLFLPF